jgi:hypothetical protein
MVMEAIAFKVAMEDKDREKHREAEEWKKSGFDELRERASQ